MAAPSLSAELSPRAGIAAAAGASVGVGMDASSRAASAGADAIADGAPAFAPNSAPNPALNFAPDAMPDGASAIARDSARVSALAALLARPDVWRGGDIAVAPAPTFASGHAALDAELPGGGWPRGQLTELLCAAPGIGELSLLLPALAGLAAPADAAGSVGVAGIGAGGAGGAECGSAGGSAGSVGSAGAGRQGRSVIVLIAPPFALHAPAWVAAGVPPASLRLIVPRQPRDALWAGVEALRCPGVAATVLWLEPQWHRELPAASLRRLHLAAGEGGGGAFLYRPAAVAAQSSPAPLRLQLDSAGDGRLRVVLLKRRGPPAPQPLLLDLPRPARPRLAHALDRPAPTAEPRRPVAA